MDHMQLRNTGISFFAVCLVLLLASVAVSQTDSNGAAPQSERPIHMLVIGDSILWGQGLKTEQKSWYRVKLWLEKNTGRRVIERIEAHSGAVIERHSATDNKTSDNREVNLALPTLHEVLDDVLREYANPSEVELILVSGCGNDVGALNLLNATSTSEAAEMTRSKCGRPVENLLRRVLQSFPAAYVVVTGYYPVFSEKTRNDFVLSALTKRFVKTERINQTKMTSKEIFNRLRVNSSKWYESSNDSLAEAVRNVNAEAGTARVTFAKIEFPPSYSFAAPSTHLWGLDRSPFRMTLLLLSFGKIQLPSNDSVRGYRAAGCSEVYKRPSNETPEQKKERKALKILCKYAALGHPNKKGAVLYADAITHVLNPRFRPVTSKLP
jgi:lysophospholipase L1-like esterase